VPRFFYLVCEAIGTAATPGLLCQPRVIVKMIVWRSRWNVDWQGKPKFSEKTCPGATFVQHKIPHDQTRVWTRAAAVGSRRLTAWAMARPLRPLTEYFSQPWHLIQWRDSRGICVRFQVQDKNTTGTPHVVCYPLTPNPTTVVLRNIWGVYGCEDS
jgi:hypothetical protein